MNRVQKGWKRGPYLFTGFFMLLISSYLDNVRGPLLPVIARDLNISYGLTGFFLTIGNIAAALSIISLIPLSKILCDRRISCGIGVFAIVSVLFSHLVGGYSTLLILAIMLGAAIAVLGTLSNILTIKGTESEERGRYLSGLHVTYGAASLIAPLLAGYFLSKDVAWPWLFSGSVILSFSMVTYIYKFLYDRDDGIEVSKPVAVPVKKDQKLLILKVLILAVFTTYVGGEVLTSMWLATYLVEYKKFSISDASFYVSCFFLILALSRTGSFIFGTVRRERAIIWSSLVASLVCMLLGHVGSNLAFSFAGILGPFFPLFLARVSRIFAEAWQSFTILLIAAIQLFLGIAHFCLGSIVDVLGVQRAFLLPCGFLVLSMVLLLFFEMMERKLVIS